jgi:hypothetical protein
VSPIHQFQIWLVGTLSPRDTAVDAFMQTAWGWPTIESLHFLGLCLLIGGVGTFDLRLLGVARRVPIAAVHHLIPWGIAGFVINIITGSMFVLSEPDQYIYNPSFHLKLLFLTVAGFNASLFYVTSWRQVFTSAATLDAPRRAKVIAAISLCAWIGVITCGRLITFFRPGPCFAEQGLLITCEKSR